MKKKILIGALTFCLLSCVLVVSACSSTPKANITFGTDGEDTHCLYVKNTTEKTITSVGAIPSNKTLETKLEANPTDATWAASDTACIKLESIGAQAGQTSQGEIVIKSTYELKFYFEDGTSLSIHSLAVENIDKMKDVSLAIDSSGAIAYLLYKDSEGNEITTLSTERNIYNEQKAKAEEKARQEAEEQAALAAALAQKDSGYASSSSSSSSKSSGSSSQSSDGCVEGGVQLR